MVFNAAIGLTPNHSSQPYKKEALKQASTTVFLTTNGVVYNVSKENRRANDEIVYSTHDKQNTRWKRILQADDTKSLWRGINWKGEFREFQSKDPGVPGTYETLTEPQ